MTRFAIDRRDRDVAILTALIIAVLASALASRGISAFRPDSYLANLILFFYVALVWAILRILKILFVDRPEEPTRMIIGTFLTRELLPRYISAGVVLACLLAFMPAFSAMKGNISGFNAYGWDNVFITLDRQIHGSDPWRILHPLVGYPIITSILSGFYHFWLILLYAVSFYFLVHKNAMLRQRFFLSYFLCWSIIGVGMAIAFASVGPCFAEPIAGRDDFAPLMHYLRQADQSYPVLVLDVQNMLLTKYENRSSGLGSGISAMPSMHVSVAMLFFFAFRHVSKLAAWLSGTFLVLIMIGSVHLAYHYAVDGYVSIIVTALIWKLTGWWVARPRTMQSIAGTPSQNRYIPSHNEVI
jgi:PAP2 superfamily